jgi:hypothetical protein
MAYASGNQHKPCVWEPSFVLPPKHSTSFVDEPRRAVQEGDTLVAELMQKLANSFAEERQSLETQWDRGDDVHRRPSHRTPALPLLLRRTAFGLAHAARASDLCPAPHAVPEETRPPRGPARPRQQPPEQASVP